MTIEISRALARDFRAAAGRSARAAPRGPWPGLYVQAGPDGLTLSCAGGGVTLTYRDPAPRPEAELAFPADRLAAFAGAAADPVALSAADDGSVEARWADAAGPQTVRVPSVAAGDRPPTPAWPEEWASVDPMLPAALAEAARTAAREPGRYALHRVQLRGRRGEVVASDGKQLLAWRGFDFPFADDLLVPALPAFGLRALAAAGDVRVSRAGDAVAVEVGPWRVALAVDAGRYPDVDSVVPKGLARTAWEVDPADAAALLERLAGLPGATEESAPLTLDLGPAVAVRAADAGSAGVAEVGQPRSHTVGAAARLVVDRRLLARALRLGLTSFGYYGPGRPVVARDDRRRFVFMLLDPASAVPPADHLPTAALTPISATRPDSDPLLPASPPARHDQVTGPRDQSAAADLLSEVQVLRDALTDAQARLGRLAAGLQATPKPRGGRRPALAAARPLNCP